MHPAHQHLHFHHLQQQQQQQPPSTHQNLPSSQAIFQSKTFFLQMSQKADVKRRVGIREYCVFILTLAFWTGLPLESSFISTVDVMISTLRFHH